MQPRLLKHPARLAGASLLRLQDDNRLVALAREGHDPAFAAIVDRYGPQLERYCARLLGPGRAEDAVQQAFVNAHAAMRATDQELALKPWLYRIAHNAALNILRASKGEERGAGRGSTPAPSRRRTSWSCASSCARRSPRSRPSPPRSATRCCCARSRAVRTRRSPLALGVTAGGARQHLHRARMSLRAAASAITPYPILSRVLNAAADEGGRRSGSRVRRRPGRRRRRDQGRAGVLAAGAIAGGAVRRITTAPPSRTAAGRVTWSRDRSTTANAAGSPQAARRSPRLPRSSGATSHGAGGHRRPSAHGRRHDGTSDSGAPPRALREPPLGRQRRLGRAQGLHRASRRGLRGSTGTSGTSDDDGLSHSGSGSSGSGSDDTTTTAVVRRPFGFGLVGLGLRRRRGSARRVPAAARPTRRRQRRPTELSGSGSGSSGSGDADDDARPTTESQCWRGPPGGRA